jgi:uncharacterized protein (TIGR03000 family)
MNRFAWKILLIGAVVAASLTAFAPSADAHWGSYYYPSYWGVSYAPAYSVGYAPAYSVGYDPGCCGDGGWYLGVRPGPIRRAFFGPYRYYWAGYGYGYGYNAACCYPTVSYSLCCNDGMMGAVTSPTTAQPGAPAGAGVPAKPADTPTPAVKQPTKPTLPPPPGDDEPAAKPGVTPLLPDLGPEKPASKTGTPGLELRPGGLPGLTPGSLDGGYYVPTPATSGLLTVAVPYNAKVFINGMATTSTGSKRQFVSYGLKPGLSYKYVVRAEWVREGQLLEQTTEVILTAGSREGVALNFNPPAPKDEDVAQN